MEETRLNYLWRLFLLLVVLASGIQALEIQLGNATVTLTPERSCCGRTGSDQASKQLLPHGQCRCDAVCSIYGDCCLDYVFLHPDAEHETTVFEAVDNCSETWASGGGPELADNRLPIRGGPGYQCLVWQSSDVAAPGPVDEEAVRVYLCQLRSLWQPVILKRSTTRRFAIAPGVQRYRLLRDCWKDASAEEIEACDQDRTFDSIKDLHDIISLLPVTASDGMHYINIHCAECHSFESQDVVFWESNIHCRKQDLDITAILSTNISFVAEDCFIYGVNVPLEFPWNISEPRLLSERALEAKCKDLPEYSSSATACRAYSSPSDGYSNPHCEMCVGTPTGPGRNDSSSKCQPFCIVELEPMPISFLFDFSPVQGASVSIRGQSSPTIIVPDCDRGHFYDASSGRCRVFHCPTGQMLANDGVTCVFLGDQSGQCPNGTDVTTDDPDYFSCSILIQGDVALLDDHKWHVIVGHLGKELGVAEFDTAEMKDDSTAQKMNASDACSLIPLYSYRIEFRWHSINATIGSYVKAIQPILGNRCWNLTTFQMSFSVLNVRLMTFKKEVLVDECAKRGQEIKVERSGPGSVTELSIGNVSYIQFLKDNMTVACPSSQTYQEVSIFPGNGTRAEWYIYSCKAKLHCPVIFLNSSEFAWTSHNGAEIAAHRVNGQNFSADDLILMTGGTIAVCRSQLALNVSRNDSTRPDDVPAWILSGVGITVSQVFLALSLFNYYMFAELRKLPGKNMISFILALFALQLTFLLSMGSPLYRYTASSEASCLAFAVLVHYQILTVFFWSNAISFHFVRTFGGGPRLRAAEARRGHRTFVLYSLYGWGAPVCLVFVSCMLHFLAEIDGLKKNVYGKACLIKKERILFFAVPVFCLMCLNFIFFVCTVVGIRRTRSQTSLAHKGKGSLETMQLEFKLCIKIFIATGMVWFIVFILAFFEFKGLSYLISIIFTLQGPLVFFAFAFNQRVRGLWRRKLSCATKRSRKTSTGCTAMATIATTMGRSSSVVELQINSKKNNDNRVTFTNSLCEVDMGEL